MATLSLLSRVIESQWHDAKIVSIRDWVQSGTGDEGWTVHSDGSLRYRGRVVVPNLTDLREEILREFHYSIFHASRWHEDVLGSSSSVLLEWDEETRSGLCATMSHVYAGKG